MNESSNSYSSLYISTNKLPIASKIISNFNSQSNNYSSTIYTFFALLKKKNNKRIINSGFSQIFVQRISHGWRRWIEQTGVTRCARRLLEKVLLMLRIPQHLLHPRNNSSIETFEIWGGKKSMDKIWNQWIRKIGSVRSRSGQEIVETRSVYTRMQIRLNVLPYDPAEKNIYG